MRKLLSIFFLLIASNLWALHIECIGNALEIHQGQDTILIFDGQPHLRSKVGNVDWYYIANHELIQANTDETEMIDVSIDHGIIVEKDGQILE